MLESYLCSDVIISIPRHEDVLQSCNLSAVGRSVTGTASGSKCIQITRVWLGVLRVGLSGRFQMFLLDLPSVSPTAYTCVTLAALFVSCGTRPRFTWFTLRY